MVVFVRNLQKIVPVCLKTIEKETEILLRVAEPWSFSYDVGLHLLTDKKMQALNKRFHYKNKPTDVLSFPVYKVCFY